MQNVMDVITPDQLAFLDEHDELISALFELATSEKFKILFGELSMGEVLDRLEYTLKLGDEYDPVLKERYVRLTAADPAETLKKLRESARLWDEVLSE